jgi:topoisomerase-4 subunit B
VREGMVGAVAIRLKDPVFESQTKNKLGNTELRTELVKEVQRVVEDLLHRDPKRAERVVAKVRGHGEAAQGTAAGQEAGPRAGARDLHPHPPAQGLQAPPGSQAGQGADSMVFITEGQSAAGSIVSCRDVHNQAIFVLKGKPMNVASSSATRSTRTTSSTT